jgi:hypothetical protein
MTVSTTAAAAEVADAKNVFERILRMAGRSPVRVAAVFALTGRLLFSAIAAVYVWHLKLDPLLVDSNQFAGHLMRCDGSWRYALLGAWERFDTLWYIHLAQSGYDYPAAVPFYPLYPLLIALTYLPPLAAALLISTVSSFLFAWGFQKLIQLDYPAEASVRALILYLVFPTGFILFAGYPESLLLCLIVWALYFARMGRVLPVAAMALLAGGSKALGTLVFLPIAWIAIRNRKWGLLGAGAAAFVAPLGMGLWFQATARISVQQAYTTYWTTTVSAPWQIVWHALTTPAPFRELNLLALAFVAVLALSTNDRLEYTLFTAGVIGILLSRETVPVLHSMSRYVLVIFPAFIYAGGLFRSRVSFALLAAAMFVLEVNVLEQFLHWSFIV